MTMILFIALKMALPSAPWCSGSHPQDATLQQDPSCALLFYVLKCPAKTQHNSRVLSWNKWEWRHYFGWEIPAILRKSTLEGPVVVFWRKRQGDPGCTVFCCCWYSWQSGEALAPPRYSLQMLRRLLQLCKGNTVAQTHMRAHTHTHVCQFPLLPCSLTGKKGKAFLSFLIPPMTGTFSFLHFWLKSRCCSGSVLHFPPGQVSKCCTTLDVNFSWRTSTWRSQGAMHTLHLPNKLLDLHFAIHPSVLLAMKPWSLLLAFPAGSQF